MRRESYRTEWGPGTLRALRRHLGLTQSEMARELGTRQQTISEWERGLYSPRGTSRTLLRVVAERAGFQYGASPEKASSEGGRPQG